MNIKIIMYPPIIILNRTYNNISPMRDDNTIRTVCTHYVIIAYTHKRSDIVICDL